MKTHEFYLELAIELAQRTMQKGIGGPFGALVVEGDKILAEGYNSVSSLNDPTAHAEIQAIRQACSKLKSFQLSNCIVYSSCEPCPMCLGALYWARPIAVYFASTRQDAAAIQFDDAFIYDEIMRSFDQRKIPFNYLPLKTAKDLFGAWTNKQDKVLY